jgi:type IV pilus assembly protein PilO
MALEANFDFEELIEKLARIPKAARLGAALAVVIAVGCGYYFLYYQAAAEELTNLRGQAEELQRKLNKVRVVASNLSDFEQEVAGLQRSLDAAVKQLPDKKQFEDLLRDISTAGKKVGVTVKSVQRTKVVPHNFYAEVPFRLELEGSYHNLARFFERMSNLPRIVNMGSMVVKTVKESEAQTTLSVVGTATTFRFIQKG